MQLWDTQTGKHKSILKEHHESVSSVAYSTDGNTLITVDPSGIVLLWDIRTRKFKYILKEHIGGIDSIAFSPDGTTIAIGSLHTVRLLDAHTGKHQTTFKGHTDHIISATFSPDGNTLATASSDNIIMLWDTQTRKHRTTINNTFANYPGFSFCCV